MLTFKWSRYVGAQLEGAEILANRADEILGYEPTFLRRIATDMIAAASRHLRHAQCQRS